MGTTHVTTSNSIGRSSEPEANNITKQEAKVESDNLNPLLSGKSADALHTELASATQSIPSHNAINQTTQDQLPSNPQQEPSNSSESESSATSRSTNIDSEPSADVSSVNKVAVVDPVTGSLSKLTETEEKDSSEVVSDGKEQSPPIEMLTNTLVSGKRVNSSPGRTQKDKQASGVSRQEQANTDTKDSARAELKVPKIANRRQSKSKEDIDTSQWSNDIDDLMDAEVLFDELLDFDPDADIDEFFKEELGWKMDELRKAVFYFRAHT